MKSIVEIDGNSEATMKIPADSLSLACLRIPQVYAAKKNANIQKLSYLI